LPYSAIYSALWNLQKRGIITKGKGRGSFYLLNEEKARDYLGGERENLFNLQGITTTLPEGVKAFFGKFLDMDLAFLEKFEVTGVCLKWYSFKPLREHLAKLAKANDPRVKVSGKKERSQKLSFTVESFSLTVSLHGKLGLWVRSIDWVAEFTEVLEAAGISDLAKVDVFESIMARLPDAKASVEIPILVPRSELPRAYKVETKAGDKEIISRIASSHFPAELEIAGNWDQVQGYLSALAASQHFSALQVMQTDSLRNIEKKMDNLASPLISVATKKIMEALQTVVNVIDELNSRLFNNQQAEEANYPSKPQEQQEPKPKERKDMTLC